MPYSLQECLRRKMASCLKMVTVQQKAMYILWFFKKQCLFSKYRIWYEKCPFSDMLSDTGQSNFRRPGAFHTEKEQKDQALNRKMLIDSRKCFTEAHEEQEDELLRS